MSEAVHIIAVITVPVSHTAQAEAACRRCIAPSRQEGACQRYNISRDLEKPGRFVADEIWASPAGFEAHLASPHFQALAGILHSLGAELDIMKVQPLSPEA